MSTLMLESNPLPCLSDPRFLGIISYRKAKADKKKVKGKKAPADAKAKWIVSIESELC